MANAFARDVERHLEENTEKNTGRYPTWRADGLGGHVGGGENDEVVSLGSVDWPASEALRRFDGSTSSPQAKLTAGIVQGRPLALQKRGTNAT